MHQFFPAHDVEDPKKPARIESFIEVQLWITQLLALYLRLEHLDDPLVECSHQGTRGVHIPQGFLGQVVVDEPQIKMLLRSF